MGRAGSGGRSGGRSVSGHSSGGHRASGHHIGSSSGHRAGSSGSFSSSWSRSSRSFSNRAPHYGGPMVPPPPRRFGRSRHSGGFSAALLFVIILVFIVFCFAVAGSNSAGAVSNSKNREKADTGITYQNDCIIDELGWFDNITRTERELQHFYNETGVQPYIVLKAYDSTLVTDSEKDAYAEAWYTENIDNEGTLLYMYFAEEDTDNDVGYMTLINGKQISSVMDSEAIEIFWNYMDNQWYGDASTDDMFVNVFTKTADTIMTKSTTKADILKYVVIGIVVIGIGCTVLLIMKRKRQYEAEKAAETERILKTPLSGSDDSLVDKYLK